MTLKCAVYKDKGFGWGNPYLGSRGSEKWV